MTILTALLSPVVLATAFGAVVVLGLWISHKTRTLIFAVTAAGALPMVVFYLVTLFGLWPSMETAVLYSRVALLLLAIDISMSLVYVCRMVCNTIEAAADE